MNARTLVSQVLGAKYFPGQAWSRATLSAKPSRIWPSLLWGRDLLCEGMRRRIGSGESVRIWDDRWLASFAFGRSKS